MVTARASAGPWSSLMALLLGVRPPSDNNSWQPIALSVRVCRTGLSRLQPGVLSPPAGQNRKDAMLRPQDGPTRELKNLNGLWRFRLDPAGAGRAAGSWRGPLAGARDMPVPASYNDIPADAAVRDHVGDAWYQTVVRVPRGWAGQRVVLRFDAATHRAVVWVDDVEVAAHEGGYTPFEADVTAHVRPGEEARVTVVVDNRLTWHSLPPGIVEDGRQTYFHDFFNYAGLHRSVWLYSTPPAYVDDITVVPGLERTTGTVGYRVGTTGGGTVRAVLLDAG